MHDVSALVRTSKNDLVMAYAHAFAAAEGLPKATCAMFGIVTTTEFGSSLATYEPNDAAV